MRHRRQRPKERSREKILPRAAEMSAARIRKRLPGNPETAEIQAVRKAVPAADPETAPAFRQTAARSRILTRRSRMAAMADVRRIPAAVITAAEMAAAAPRRRKGTGRSPASSSWKWKAPKQEKSLRQSWYFLRKKKDIPVRSNGSRQRENSRPKQPMRP